MDPTTYLLQRIPGYADLDAGERQAIQDFSLLWSAFEGAALDHAATPARLMELGARLAHEGRFDPAGVADALAYWRARYVAQGHPTNHYAGLRLERMQQAHQDLVWLVLSGTAASSKEDLQAVLLVVYRLRNNLFHGLKWVYGIQGQRDNFLHASTVLMRVLDAEV